MVYLVTFTLQLPNNAGLMLFDADQHEQAFSNPETVVATIKSVGPWARIQPTLWLVATPTLSAGQVREQIWRGSMHAGDMLFVMRVTKEWGAYNFDDNVVKWLGEARF